MQQLTQEDFRPLFRRYLKPGWQLALIVLLLLSSLRVLLVIEANIQASYQWLSYYFLFLVSVPLILLKSSGRRKVGLKKVDSWKGMLIGFLYGFIICGLLYVLMFYWYGHTLSNALVYISHSYQGLPAGMDTQTRFTFFVIFSISSMLFSPIGEEFFYRGFIHENFALNFGATAASVLDSLAFSLVHLAHFGFVYHQGEWSFLPLPAIIWAVALFVSCLLFYKARVQSGSIWGAVLAHAAFNLSMNYFIFYRILA